MSQIVLYSGPGSSSFCLDALEKEVKELCDERLYLIQKVDSFRSLISKSSNTRCFMVPGGNAANMMTEDYWSCRAEIKPFLESNKISYYGVCAGGLLASSAYCLRVQQQGFTFRETGNSFLGLFPEKTVHLYQATKKNEISKEDLKLISIQAGGKTFSSVCILSPGYICTNAHATMLTQYRDLSPLFFQSVEGLVHQVPPQTICESVCVPGTSTIIVAGAHLEITSRTLRQEGFRQVFGLSAEELELFALKAEQDDSDRRLQMRSHLERLGITCKPV